MSTAYQIETETKHYMDISKDDGDQLVWQGRDAYRAKGKDTDKFWDDTYPGAALEASPRGFLFWRCTGPLKSLQTLKYDLEYNLKPYPKAAPKQPQTGLPAPTPGLQQAVAQVVNHYRGSVAPAFPVSTRKFQVGDPIKPSHANAGAWYVYRDFVVVRNLPNGLIEFEYDTINGTRRAADDESNWELDHSRTNYAAASPAMAGQPCAPAPQLPANIWAANGLKP